jgi:redox-sensing transcriptional repressor
MNIPSKTVERLLVYQRILSDLDAHDVDFVHSHTLAEKANNSSAQVRRDLMTIGYSGSPAKGYAVRDLLITIQKLFDERARQKAALVGIGKLGRAILAYCALRKPRTEIVAAFDSDPSKVSSPIVGCLTYPLDDLIRVVSENRITIGIITVPAQAAQAVADLMLLAGISGILNFAPTPLKVPSWAIVENVDILTKLETLAFMTEPQWGVCHA